MSECDSRLLPVKSEHGATYDVSYNYSHMVFSSVPRSVTLNDLEPGNGCYIEVLH